MQSAIDQFRSNIGRVKALGGLYKALTQLTTSAVDSSDMLRAQIVMAVSALDHYVHKVTRLGMLEIYNGSRASTPAFDKFQVSIASVITQGIGGSGHAWFESEIREKHSYLSFQHPDRIAEAVRLFSPIQLWPAVASDLKMDSGDVKTKIRVLVERRNKIAHEADSDPSYPGVRWPITEKDVTTAIYFIESLCEAIHMVVA
jgi:hypothetical protein